MKNLIQLLIILITITGFSQGKITNDSPKKITIEWMNGEIETYSKILDIDVSEFNQKHIGNETYGKPLERVIICRIQGLGMKTKSNHGLNYDLKINVYDDGNEVYSVENNMIYKRPTLTRNKKDVIEKMRRKQLANK